MTSPSTGHSRPSLPEYLRPINFAGIELLLDLLHFARQFYSDVDLESLLILLFVSDATMRPFMLTSGAESQALVAPHPPEELRGAISRRVIADKTGLPRETVRRRVAELAAKGHVLVDDNDRVRISYGLAQPGSWRAVQQGHRAILRYSERLREFGIDPERVVDQFGD